MFNLQKKQTEAETEQPVNLTNLKTKDVLLIKKRAYFNVKMTLEGDNTKIENPLQMQDNLEDMKGALVTLTFGVKDVGNLEYSQYLAYLEEIEKQARKEKIDWIIDIFETQKIDENLQIINKIFEKDEEKENQKKIIELVKELEPSLQNKDWYQKIKEDNQKKNN